MDTLATQAFNQWLAQLKHQTIVPTLLNTELMIVMCGLARNTTEAKTLAKSWLNQAVALGVLELNPNPHTYQVREGH
jgi:hypothetical protein